MATSTDLRAAIEEVQRQLPEGQLENQLLAGGLGAEWATRLERRVGAMPWWAISATVHAVIFLLATLLTVAAPPAQLDEVTITTDVAKQKPPEYDEKKQRELFKNISEIKHDQQVDRPMVVHEEAPIAEQFQTDNNMDSQNSRGQEDAISDIPLGGTGVSGSIGVGGGALAGCFGYRDGGGRKHAVARFGGSPATESAVEAALRWLARHQEADGSWDAVKYGVTHPVHMAAGGKPVRTGCTGLALLAFLGAGHTHKAGNFRDNVRRAQDWLISKQKPNGAIHEDHRPGYNVAIAGLALAEAYGMTKDPEIGKAAQLAVDYSVKEHQNPYSGWRYDRRSGADLSVTGWFVMQLKSARVAGLKVDGAGFQGATNFLDKVTTDNGRAGYMSRSGSLPAMTAVGMVCRQFMGTPSSDPLLRGGAEHLGGNLPGWQNANDHLDFYYIYYGTLAMFQMGGQSWQQWNSALKPALVKNQRQGGPLDGSVNDVDGSWDPYGVSGNSGGRVFMTAVGALSLEVYYRYLPMYAK